MLAEDIKRGLQAQREEHAIIVSHPNAIHDCAIAGKC